MVQYDGIMSWQNGLYEYANIVKELFIIVVSLIEE